MSGGRLQAALPRCLVLWWVFVVVAFAPAAALPAHADTGERPLDLAMWRDVSGRADAAAAARQAFMPFRGAISLGSRGQAVWLRVTMPPRPGHDGDWVLMLRPTMLQHVEVYLPASDGRWQRTLIGNRHPFAERAVPTLNPAVPMPAGDAPLVAYVRVQSASWGLQLRLVTPAQAAAVDSTMHALLGLQTGLCLALTLVALLSWRFTREPLWAMSAAFDLGTLVQTFTQMGVTSRYLLPEAADLVNRLQVFVNCTHIALAMGFYVLMFRRFSSRRWAPWPFVAALATYPVQLWWIWRGDDAAAQTLCNATLLGICLLSLGMSWLFDPADRLLRWLLRGLNILLVLYLIYFMAPAFVPSLPLSVWHFYPSLPSNLITMLVVTAALARATQLHAQVLRREAGQRLLAEQQLDMERRQHERTSGMLGMLMHEIRTPLALIQAATRAIAGGRAREPADQQRATARIDEAVGDITNVLERCIETDQLERGEFSTLAAPVDVSARWQAWLAGHAQGARLQAEVPTIGVLLLDLPLWLSMAGNLVDNALKYSPPDSPVEVQLSHADGMLRLQVRNAVGEAGRPDPARLFSRHYRADTVGHVRGTGLGLYWVKLIGQRLDGDIRCLPPGDEGVVAFELQIPAAPA